MGVILRGMGVVGQAASLRGALPCIAGHTGCQKYDQ
jgi:hypothetical protein